MGLVLHTLSEDNENQVEFFSIDNPQNLLNQSISHLQFQERQLYQLINTNNYVDFIIKLRALFSEAGDMAKTLKNFKKSNLITEFDLPKTIGLTDKVINIYCDPGKEVDLVPIFKELAGSYPGIEIIIDNSEELGLSFEYNPMNIKTVLNKIEKRPKKTEFNPEAESLRAANKAFKELIKNGKIGKVVVNEDTGPIEIQEDLKNVSVQGKRENFSYTKKTIDEALQNPQARMQLIQAYQNVYNMLYNLCSTNKVVLNSFDIAWKNKIGTKTGNDDASLKKFLFLSKGGNLASGVTGAVQELYTAILGECLGYFSDKGITGRISNILGNILKDNNEQPKTDVQLFGTIGIQVKAYSLDRKITEMSTNIHPDKLDASLEKFGISNIADTIVQAVFNEDNGSYHDLESVIEPALAQLMNLDTHRDISDTVCFYMVDAEFLVPGSELLRQVQLQKPQINIRTSYETHNDKYFNEEKEYSYTNEKGYTRNKENFVQYWRGKELSSTDENIDLYKNLMSRNISIDVKFDYSFVSGYTIFG